MAIDPNVPFLDIDFDRLTELLQQQGYRVERVTEPSGREVLRSATGGLAFEIQGGSPAPAGAGRYLDVRCVAALKVEGELSFVVVNAWNDSRRYARMLRHGDMLVLTQDVSVAGGVLPAHVATQFTLWDRLVQDLPSFLRTEIARVTSRAPSTRPAAATVAEAAAPAA
ncbi:YbjN domain-containing protein [Rhodoplanes sp. TEM]|uniref:YbjN domain-containing protein n=1 Tax=Rhodoplanes tepidamans TaxID=200616 RepID=A0ABT5JCD6_RHOTP|nr:MULTISPECIES: YbjN domain-containing protein [Rhodoplanes]MDC7787026.1 YbjN domain-containing protein [Rhodoplanes tepidamans]MDC7985276.1 YbjN domain-containing protein [Rhodoplanes sp. TEM]MDQ0354249.1 hypothetical protein [Rhodoplanes tepidamans]